MIDFGYGNRPTHEQTPLRKIVLEKRQKKTTKIKFVIVSLNRLIYHSLVDYIFELYVAIG